MTNYIIISHLQEKEDQKSFEQKVKAKFPENHEETNDEVRYLALSSRNQAGAEDTIKDILHAYNIHSEDYVALYYSRPDNPDEIQRVMLLGHDRQIESDIRQLKPEDHVDVLSRLLNYDFAEDNF